jgi:hypothetical protein
MTMLDQREQALEQAFAHDEEVRFLMLTHRNKLFGHWAADLLQYTGEVGQRYIQFIVDTLSEPAHGAQTPDDKIVSRVLTDLTNAGMAMGPDDVREALSQFEAESRAAFGVG